MLRFATEAHEDQWKPALPALPSWLAWWRWTPTKPNIRRDQEGDHHDVPNADKGVFAEKPPLRQLLEHRVDHASREGGQATH